MKLRRCWHGAVALAALGAIGCDAGRSAVSDAGLLDAGLSDAGLSDAGPARDLDAPPMPGTDSDVPPAPMADASLGAGADAAIVPPPLPYYEVPTDDPSLAPHAFFPVPDVHYWVVDGVVTLTYDFPPDLSGVLDQPLEFRGPVAADGSSTISGPAGTGSCGAPVAGVVRCLEHFGPGLRLDTPSAIAAAQSITDPVARAAREAIVRQFAVDPIGIVVFDLATASKPPGGDDAPDDG